MDFHQLQYFVAIAESGSITAAAKKLFLSQPPLSMQMKRLEKELGCVLFLRGAREVQLTEAGKLLYTRAKSMLELRRITDSAGRYFIGWLFHAAAVAEMVSCTVSANSVFTL